MNSRGVRGLAVILVLLSHTAGRGLELHPMLNFHGIGHVGVYLFFCLSGFLLTNNLLTEHAKYNSVSYSRYFVRRFFRIAPLYYVVITYVFALQLYTGSINTKYLHINNGWQGYIEHLIFYKGDSVFWTIPTEVFFYLLIPLIFVFFLKYRSYWLIFLSVISVVFSIWTLASISNIVEGLPSPKIVDIKHGSQFIEVFLIGCIAAFVMGKKWFGKYCYSRYGKFVITVSAIILMVVTVIFVAKKFLIFDMPYYELRWFSIVYAVIFSLVIVISKEDGVLNRFFSNKYLVVTGVLGFSIYLIHFEVIKFVNLIDTNSYIKLVICIPLIYFISYLTYRFIENPFVMFSKKIFVNRGVDIYKNKITH